MKRVWEYHRAGSTASVGSKLKCLLLSTGGSLINFKWNRRDLYVFVVVVFGLIAICTPPGGGCLTYFRFVQLPLTHACVRSFVQLALHTYYVYGWSKPRHSVQTDRRCCFPTKFVCLQWYELFDELHTNYFWQLPCTVNYRLTLKEWWWWGGGVHAAWIQRWPQLCD